MPLVRRLLLLPFLAAVAAAAPGARAEAEPPIPPGMQRQRPPAFPSAALAAAARNWKLERAEERAKQPGAAGQIDLFWEILALLEKDEKGEKARKDKDLEAVLEWLLFGAGLRQNTELREPVYVKVPACSPGLGARLFDERLAAWIAQAASNSAGTGPWNWPEYPTMNRRDLASAAKRQMEQGPKHNPVARLWMAAALLASDDAEGAKVFREAAEALAKNMPDQANALAGQAVKGMAEAGVKSALGPLLDLAGKEAAASNDAGPETSRSYRNRDALGCFYRLMGWDLASDSKTSGKALVDAARAWLAENAGALKWNPQLRRFASEAPPPGRESLYKHGAAVEKKYGVKVFETVNANRHADLLGELTALMEKKPEAAADKDVEELYLEILAPQAQAASYGSLKKLVFERAPKASASLGARIWALVLRDVFSRLDEKNRVDPVCAALEKVFKSVPEADTAVRDLGCAQLQPEFRKRYEEMQKGKDDALFADAAFAYLQAGGTLSIDEMKALIDRVPPTWYLGQYDYKLLKCLDRLQETGRPIVLRLQLLAAAKEVADRRGSFYAAYRFANATGFSTAGGFPPPSAQLAAKFAQWFAKHEKELRWDPKRKRFVGAPLEDDSPLLHVADAVSDRYGIEFPNTINHFDWYRQVLDALLELSAKNAEAAKDPLFVRMLLGVVETGKMFRDSRNVKRLLVVLPTQSRELGRACWVKYLDMQLGFFMEYPDGEGLRALANLDKDLEGHDRKLAAEARAELGAAFKERYENSAEAPLKERIGLMLCCLYLGLDAEAMGIDKLGQEIRDHSAAMFSYLNYGAVQLAQNGCVGALFACLVSSKYYPLIRDSTSSTFDRLLFPAESQTRTWTRKGEGPDDDTRWRWLSAHAKEITWDPGLRCFVVPAAAGRPAAAAAPAAPEPPDGPKAVVPPKPKEPDGF